MTQSTRHGVPLNSVPAVSAGLLRKEESHASAQTPIRATLWLLRVVATAEFPLGVLLADLEHLLHGKVEGNVIAEVVTAHATSEIHGILKSQNLTVESGASLEGEIHSSSRKQGASNSPSQKTNNEAKESARKK
jgi:hypothetical protein